MSYILTMQKLTTKSFDKWKNNENIEDSALIDGIRTLEDGLSIVDLGGGLFKVRIPRVGQGKSGGFRTIVVYKSNDRAIFIHGFAKSDRDNISKKELTLFKEFASSLLSLTSEQINLALNSGALKKITGDDENA